MEPERQFGYHVRLFYSYPGKVMRRVALGMLPWFSMLPLAEAIAEEVAEKLDSVEVVAVSPLQHGGVDINKIPAHVQTVSADQLQKAQSLSLADYMNRYLGSVNINDVQQSIATGCAIPRLQRLAVDGIAARPGDLCQRHTL